MWLLFTLHSFSAGPVLLAHIILIDFQRLAFDIRTALVGWPFTLRLIVLPGLLAHIILIHVQRLALDIRTALVALLFTGQLIILLGQIATMRAYGVLHFELQECRVALRTSTDAD